MDIEQFYSADERRRQSAEVEFGTNWFDAKGSRYELSWVEDTCELYAMFEPVPEVDVWTPFGDAEVSDVAVDTLTVLILGKVDAREDVERILAGWEDRMTQPEGVEWIAAQLEAAGVQRPQGG
jgi:hypothetical protein